MVNKGAEEVVAEQSRRHRMTAVAHIMALYLLVPFATVAAQDAQPSVTFKLPQPESDPLGINMSRDPLVSMLAAKGPLDPLVLAVNQAIARAPIVDAAAADVEAADAGRDEAKAALFPSVDLAVNGSRSVARNFSNDPLNIVERSRGKSRVDGTLSVNQLVFDFGATSKRIEAASARLESTGAAEQDTGQRIAIQTISAYYRVLAYRLLVFLGEDNADQLLTLLKDAEFRVAQGALAKGDLTRIESAIAQSEAQRARFLRARETSEIAYAQLVGAPANPNPVRPTLPEFTLVSDDALRQAAAKTPEVKAALANAKAAQLEAAAAKSEMLPNVSVGVDAGRYGIENPGNNYDVRLRATLRQRLFGGLSQRAKRLSATASAADFRAQAALEEAELNAMTALRDEVGIVAQLEAQQMAYVAARKARDVQRERFKVSRGTLFEALESHSAYYQTAVDTLQLMLERDTARYTVLVRTGSLFDALNIKTRQDNRGW